MMQLPKEITYDGKRVRTDDYIRAKVKSLREFGYASLTEQEARAQLEHVLAEHDMSQGLTIIGVFMRDEVSQAETK